MSLAVDSSSPPRVTGAGADGTVAVTTAAFDPPASVLIATVQANARPHGATATISNNGAPLTWTTVAERSAADSGGSRGVAGIYIAPLASTRTGLTITATVASVGGTGSEINSPSIKVYVVTGAAVSPVGGSAKGSSTTNDLTTGAFTTVGASSLLFAAGVDWNALGGQSSSDLTVDGFDNGNVTGVSGYKTLGAPGASATANLIAGGSGSAEWNWVTAEILASSPVDTPYRVTVGATAVPLTPADTGPVGRRLIVRNTNATPANTVALGGTSSVTANNGFLLDGGAQLVLPLSAGEELWAVRGGSTDVAVHILRLGD